MTKILLFFLLGLILGISTFHLGIKSRLEPKVLAEKVEITPTPTSTPTETTSPSTTPESTESPTLKPTQIPKAPETPSPVPQPTFTPSEINSFIERFSGQYGVDPNVLRHIALCESGLNPISVNGPYAGLFQFSSNTWSNYRKKMGEDEIPDLRLNAEEAVQTAAYVLSLRNTYVWPNCTP